jgi:hypothetical protein
MKIKIDDEKKEDFNNINEEVPKLFSNFGVIFYRFSIYFFFLQILLIFFTI